MLSWFRKDHVYSFRVALYRQETTWVAHAVDPNLSGFGASRKQALAEVRAMLESFVESLQGDHRIAVQRPVKSDKEVRQLGKLRRLEIPNPSQPRRRLEWTSMWPRFGSARS